MSFVLAAGLGDPIKNLQLVVHVFTTARLRYPHLNLIVDEGYDTS